MTTFPGSPRLTRGAIVGMDVFNPLASVIIFQYNPHTVTRSLKPRGASEGAGSEAQRLAGPPEETIQVEIEIDATDQLEKAEDNAVSMGVYPQLSALEMLVYPKSALVIANTALLAAGTIEVVPPIGPMTLFIWGNNRVVPVKLEEFSIAEDAFDVNLNPIRAKVTLSMKVLTYNDLPLVHPGYAMFLSHQIVKETMAVIGSINDIGSIS